MGPNLNCFEWSNHVSGFLDGNLPPAIQKLAGQHLDECKDCSERNHRYRQILDSIRSLKRISAPAKIKYERDPQEGPKKTQKSNRWSRADQFIRPVARYLRSLNARSWAWISVSLFGFVVLTSLPKLRAMYEARVQHKLDAIHFAEMPITHDTQDTGDSQDVAPLDDFGGEEGDDTEAINTDSGSGDPQGKLQKTNWQGEWDQSRSTTEGKGQSSTGAQVWRFIMRTDSPQELRQNVQGILLKAGALPSARMIHGFIAPGGIQFDVLVPSESIQDIQDALKRLSDEHSPAQEQSASDNPFPTEPFTWYRNRSKRPLPSGAARVIIWLSLT